MRQFSSIRELKDYLDSKRSQQIKVGFVPTMGYLHKGHLSLVEHINRNADICVVSIYVNPLQFNNAEDLKKYPRDLERDIQLLSSKKVDVLFAPPADEIGPLAQNNPLVAGMLGQNFEGEFRPGHFDGVVKIVAALFNVVQPNYAAFGEKDFQQLRIIEEVVRQQEWPIQILRVPIVREEDGLALSSRNVRLSEAGRKAATAISRGLKSAEALFKQGIVNAEALKNAFSCEVQKEPLLKEEYNVLVDDASLTEKQKADQDSRILTAVWCEDVRLIDNIQLR